jgi:nucleotide-binding universal stress UspA family protein
MFRKIVLPVDLSEEHGPALKIAVELAGQSGGEVSLLHVVELIPGLSMDEEKGFYTRLEKLARAHLHRLSQQLSKAKIPWREEVVYGNRGVEIIRYARETATDLIVLSAPRLHPDNLPEGWGSVSYKVGLVAPCPVLLVKY